MMLHLKRLRCFYNKTVHEYKTKFFVLFSCCSTKWLGGSCVVYKESMKRRGWRGRVRWSNRTTVRPSYSQDFDYTDSLVRKDQVLCHMFETGSAFYSKLARPQEQPISYMPFDTSTLRYLPNFQLHFGYVVPQLHNTWTNQLLKL